MPYGRAPFQDALQLCVLRFLPCFFSFKQHEDLFNGDDQDAEGQVEEHLCVSPDVY